MKAPPVFRQEGFARLVTAQGLSSFGDWLATFALMALVLDISGSAAAVGGVLALRLIPAAAAGSLVVWAGSRWGRHRLLLALDLSRACAVALIPLVRSLWWVYTLTLAVEVAAVLAVTVRDASIRDLVDVDHLPIANGIVLGAMYGAIPLGAAAFTAIGFMVGEQSLFGSFDRFYLAFWLDALTFFGSYLFIKRIRRISNQAELATEGDEAVHLRDAWGVDVVRMTLVPIVAASVGIGTLFSLGIGFVRDTLGASEAQFGLLVLVFGVGAVAGLGVRQITGQGGVAAVRMAVMAMGGVLVVMSFAPGLGSAFAMAVAFGMAGAYAIVSGITLLQTDLDSADQLLALGGFHVAVRVALALGAVAAGLAADLLGRGAVELFGIDEPIRMVLLLAGFLVLAASWLVRDSVRPAG